MLSQTMPNTHSGQYDVVILGGALSGAATAVQLLRQNKALKVLIVEKSESFGRRVGESTVEVSAYFMGHVLGLTRYMNDCQLPKQGMRFWFTNEETRSIADCSEFGPQYNVRLPGYQLDRATFDEKVLSLAVEAGAELMRPARVGTIELHEGGVQRLVIESDAGEQTVETRWLVDASGVAAVIARRQNWLVTNEEHPIATVWSRFKNTGDFDGLELAERYPQWAGRSFGVRGQATNHLVGHGYWIWWIPLKGGDVSIGVVYDQRLMTFPQEGGSLGERLMAFLRQHPVGGELLANASFTPGDVHARKNLAYRSTTFASDGVALVGDSAGFMDPFYSPGMDWISFTTHNVSRLILAERSGSDIKDLLAVHNQNFATAYKRWFEALYKDKYFYMGDYELMQVAFRLDLGLYYLGVVQNVVKYGSKGLDLPPFSHAHAGPAHWLMAGYNRRLSAMARSRKERGQWGRANAHRYYGFNSYRFAKHMPLRVAKAYVDYLALEVTEGWRTWFGGKQ
ncbi:MAG: NAD(P)/FAD-dependent oxidoreductase [Verrucomicrobiota bacterium]|nr:NAD(P)/FAD-dependent oxidoreductase [Verrucomicrobiota bacterium]